MFRQVRFCSFLLVHLCVLLIIGIISCSEEVNNALVEDDDNALVEDNNPWVGTWTLETLDGVNFSGIIQGLELFFKSLAAAFEEDEEDGGIEFEFSYTDDWTFDNDGTWYRVVSMTLPDEDDTLETTSIEVEGTFAVSGSNYTLTVKSSTFPEEFELPDELGSDAASEFGYVGEDTGTWLVSDCDLTLTSNTGHIIRFEKK